MPTVLVIDVKASTVIERDETSFEATQREIANVAHIAEIAAQEAAQVAAASVRAKLAELGLSDDEISALVGA